MLKSIAFFAHILLVRPIYTNTTVELKQHAPLVAPAIRTYSNGQSKGTDMFTLTNYTKAKFSKN